jgi:uncharacterized protein (TIGR02996 family)
MTDEQALLAAVIASPDDDLPRLVYADWLDDHGQPERAEFIRVQVERSKLSATDSLFAELRARETKLLKKYKKLWAADLRVAFPGCEIEFRRGFAAVLRRKLNELGRYERHLPKLPFLEEIQITEVYPSYYFRDPNAFAALASLPRPADFRLRAMLQDSPSDPDGHLLLDLLRSDSIRLEKFMKNGVWTVLCWQGQSEDHWVNLHTLVRYILANPSLMNSNYGVRSYVVLDDLRGWIPAVHIPRLANSPIWVEFEQGEVTKSTSCHGLPPWLS